ncbi:amyloid beta A4 precursor protein-binding family B member 1-interacting protein isoform X4 [Nasonia vitripennis]|uniref:Pico n=1 Tax=Nasonia vitripennis TaxID=7425 RepID=A0A7M7QMQ2_NASVI|nr:amyloid beta A4 precursor protein-binding family B member 1-interacting protein isoform X4 [Nasonia vitripennis]XP_031789308.1 amyloid beta A4 precursor protein-binding family B member 1-interacting protein isoform X4 [Nasonia vitripennis]
MDRYEEEGGEDSDNETDPEQLMNEWLSELDSLAVSLNNVSSATLRPYNPDINTPRIDSYRISMANLEDSQDVDLDAILGELCALEQRCENDIASAPTSDNQRLNRPTNGRINPGENTDIGKNEAGMRTDSPDNDSAFSDTVSMLSSESSASSSGSGHKPPQTAIHTAPQQQPHQLMDAASRAKAEKIRLALEKMREASVQKLFIKVFTLDGSGKSLLVDENMSVAHVCRLLADKNHVPMDPKYAVVEHLPDLFMERVYEDHELLVENLLLWTRDSKNKLLFVERPDKTQLFLTPERFLLGPSDRGSGEYDDHSRNILLEEFFSSSNAGVPEVEGPLYLKSDSKKGWKRYHFILRASGLYYWPKEKARTARDLVCLATFDVNQVYYGVGWRKKYKAPTDFCFAVKHPRLQQAKSTKYIKFLCAEDNAALERWMVGIRVAKYGPKIMENYRTLVDELAQEDLDLLAHARSCSVSSIATTPANQAQYNTANDNARQFNECSRHNGDLQTITASVPTTNSRHYESLVQRQSYSSQEQRQSYNSDGRLSRASSSSSSGCLSDGAPSSCEVAFECGEFPTGTIKRKPSMNPKLPLTSITRQLKEVGETVRDEPDCPSPTSSGSGTLTRRHSRRRSGTDSDGSGTLKRHHRSGNATPVSPAPPGTPVKERASPMNYSRNENQELKSPTSPIQPCMMDSITSLPPPPPSPSRLSEEVESDGEPLPPPPPEMFRSNLSLDSLPPPPAPGELLLCNTPDLSGSSLSLASLPPPPSPLVGETSTIRRAKPKLSSSSTPTNSLSPDSTPTHHSNQRLAANNLQLYSASLNNGLNGSQNSSPLNSYPGSNASTPTYAPSSPNFHVASQPPPFVPPPAYGSQVASLPAPPQLVRQNSKLQAEPIYGSQQPQQPQTNGSPAVKPNPGMDTVRRSALKQTASHYATPPYLAELKVSSSPQPQRRVTIQEPPMSPKPSKTGTAKKISFQLPPQQEPGSPALPQRKPMPPRRSDSTRLTSPKKLAASDQAPPGDFLKDLQRVMRKKWQVAQKCKLDTTTTPHEVLGFRDPPPAIADYRETNVSNWVQEHYGADNLYENVYTTDPNAPVEYVSSAGGSPARQPSVRFAEESRNVIATAIAGKRRPPPPPPKRAETTQLTTRAMH